jgi:hypothetical protein
MELSTAPRTTDEFVRSLPLTKIKDERNENDKSLQNWWWLIGYLTSCFEVANEIKTSFGMVRPPLKQSCNEDSWPLSKQLLE